MGARTLQNIFQEPETATADSGNRLTSPFPTEKEHHAPGSNKDLNNPQSSQHNHADMASIGGPRHHFEDAEESIVGAFNLGNASVSLLHLQDPLGNLGDPCLQGDACRVHEIGHPIFPGEVYRLEGGNECNNFTDDDIECLKSTSQAELNHKEETILLVDRR